VLVCVVCDGDGGGGGCGVWLWCFVVFLCVLRGVLRVLCVFGVCWCVFLVCVCWCVVCVCGVVRGVGVIVVRGVKKV